MSVMWAIAWREIRSYFVSPIAYVVLTAWLLWCGLSFYLLSVVLVQQQGLSATASDTPLTAFFGGTTLFYLPLPLFVAVITMRLLAEETRSGTIESLMTASVNEWQVVVGKYLAALIVWFSMWVPTLFYVWFMSHFGPIDAGVLGSSYAGVFGLGLHYMAIGLLMSTIAKHQIIAAVLTFMAVGLLFLLGIAGDFIASDGSGKEVLQYISVWGHMSSFSKGIVDSRYLVYDLSIALLCIFTAVRVLEARRLQS